jgi:putative nucleotidyltransferase with HDIG domain
VVPTVTLAASGYWLVARELRSQAGVQLSQGSKISGTLLLARLFAAEEELAGVKQAIESRRERPGSAARLRGLTLVVKDRVDSTLYGYPPADLPAVPPSTRDHLAHGGVALVVGAREGRPRIFLVLNVSARSPGTRLWGEISSEFLWGEGESESLAPPGVDVCVHATSTPAPLYCSAGAAISRPAGEHWRQGRSSEIVEHQGRKMVTGTSSVFLAYKFSAEPWIITLQQQGISALATQDFRRTVILTCITGLSLVVFASNVLLRQRLDPVAQLRESTRRLAAGDFTASVDLATGDEFQELGASFNSMAIGLRDQFALLEALQVVDRQALQAQSATAIVVAARERMGELIAQRRNVSIVVARRTPETAFLTWWRQSATGGPERAEAQVPVSALDAWQGRTPAFELGGLPDAGVLARFGVDAGGYLILPLLDRGVCFGAVVLDPGPDVFSPYEIGRMRQLTDQIALALSHNLSIERLHEMSWATLEALARTIDANSPWTAGHSERVTRLGMAIGRRMELGEDEIDRLHRGGLLHDVGKIGVPAAILDKPGPLTPGEMAIVRQHPVVGARILEPIHAFADVIGIVRHHHERFDGQGYPDGLRDSSIPPLARVTTVADVYDALVSQRPYRAGWSVERAIRFIAYGAGIRFDPTVVRAFLSLAHSSEWAEATRPVRGPGRQPLAGVGS